jgi:hypothetical protein
MAISGGGGVEEKEQDMEAGEGREAEAVELCTLCRWSFMPVQCMCMYEVKSI